MGQDKKTPKATPNKNSKVKALARVKTYTFDVDTMKKASENAVVATESIKAFLPVEKVKTYDDCMLLLNTAESVDGVLSFKACKLFQRMKNEKLYKQAGFNSFEQWASKEKGLGKVAAYNKAKAGVYINDTATATTLPRASEKYDFTFTQLVALIENGVKMDRKTGEILDDAVLQEMCEQGKIRPNMDEKEWKKAVRTLKLEVKGEKIPDSESNEVYDSESNEVHDSESNEVHDSESNEVQDNSEIGLSMYNDLADYFMDKYGKKLPQTLKNYLKGIKEYI